MTKEEKKPLFEKWYKVLNYTMPLCSYPDDIMIKHFIEFGYDVDIALTVINNKEKESE